MKRLLLLSLLLLPLLARAELTIEITRGRDNPTAIAVVPFGWFRWGSAPEDVARLIRDNLQRSGQFAAAAPGDMLSLPTREADVFYRDWRAIDVEYLLIGRLSGGDDMVVEYELYDVYKEARVLQGRQTGPAAELRMLAHRAADEIYEQLTGVPGAFATRMLYVEASRGREREIHRLMVADADGGRAQPLYESSEPLLSPTWAPDLRSVAYVSFETGRPAIYRHHLDSGLREQLTNFKGLNGAPAFSPDGSSLALVLSKGGNPDIYVMDLGDRSLRRITRHYAIDTEPAWMPDGRFLVFTSDRGGPPQIYKAEVATGKTERVTWQGEWNARASVAADGRTLVMVQQAKQQFHIAVQDLVSGRQQILTTTQLDESPSVAPNGTMVLYATKVGERGILSAVSVDGGVKFRLPSAASDVREPAWSPYLYR